MASEKDIKNQKEFNESAKQGTEAILDTVDATERLSQVMMAVFQEMSRGNVLLNESRKSYRGLLSNQQKVESIQAGLLRLSSTQLRQLKASSEIELNKLKSNAEQIRQRGAINDYERSILAAAEAGFAIELASIDALDTEIKKREDLEKKLGFTGAALENLGRIGIRALGGIGLNLSVLQQGFDKVIENAENLAGQEGVGKWRVFGEIIKGTGPVLKKSLEDPLVVTGFSVAKLVKSFSELETAGVNFGRLTGQTAFSAATLNSRVATASQYLETATELTKQLGINANNAFSSDTLAAAAEIQNLMGLSAKEAGTLAVVSQTTGTSFDSIKNSLVDSVSAFNRSNKTAISQGIVLRDVANTSEDILASFNNQPRALAEAASAARRLGLDLQKVDAIASSLLDFESSIENELQAQLLTGKELNLNKARELALTNDLAGLGQELFNNSASLAEFSSMNRIAQEGLAKSLGVSRQELAKIALQRSIELGLSDKALEAAAGVTAEDLQRLEIQKQLQISIEKISQALVGPATALASIASNAGVFYAMMSAAAGISMVRLVGQLALAAGSSIAASSALTLGLSTAAIVAGILAVTAASKKSTKDIQQVQDGIIDPQGGLVISGPKGSIQADPGDYLTASTNAPGTGGGSRRAEQLLENILEAIQKGGHVYIDGNKAGEALVLGSYKSS